VDTSGKVDGENVVTVSSGTSQIISISQSNSVIDNSSCKQMCMGSQHSNTSRGNTTSGSQRPHFLSQSIEIRSSERSNGSGILLSQPSKSQWPGASSVSSSNDSNSSNFSNTQVSKSSGSVVRGHSSGHTSLSTWPGSDETTPPTPSFSPSMPPGQQVIPGKILISFFYFKVFTNINKNVFCYCM
jgi:hypothetical protein